MNRILAAVGVLVLAGGGVAVGRWSMKPKVDDLLRTNNAIADSFQLRLDSAIAVAEERGHTIKGQEGIITYLKQINKEWGEQAEETKQVVLGLQHTVSELQQRVLANAPVEIDTAGAQVVSVNYRDEADEENWIAVDGTVTVPPPPADSAMVDLLLSAQATLTTLVSRLPDGQLKCEGRSGLPALAITALDCVDNIEDPINEMVRQDLLSEVLGTFTEPKTLFIIAATALTVLLVK